MFSDQDPDYDKYCLHKLFPLNDTVIRRVKVPGEVVNPIYSDRFVRVNPNCFAMKVPGTGAFFACNGNMVEYGIEPGADPQWVHLYLNGQVLVALLHQRKIINFHASSFVYEGRGVMILGESGAGKSSLTLAFALLGGGFLTDDLTPVVFEDSAPCIMPLHRKVKIRKDTAEELGIDPLQLTKAENGTGKKYFSIAPVQMNPFPLKVIVKIEAGPVETPLFIEPSPAERFSLLRSEVCSWEILAGMPETEKVYLHQLVALVEKTEFVRVLRPSDIGLKEFSSYVREVIDNLGKR